MNGTNIPPITIAPDFLSKEDIEILKKTILKLFSEDEQTSFLRLCQRTRLDPFTRQIYATKRTQKVFIDGQSRKVPVLVPVTSVIGLTSVADRTGLYEGCEVYWTAPDGVWRTEWLEDDFPAAAKCIVHRHGRKYPEIAIARWMSYCGQSYNYDTKKWEISDFWTKMPDFMLGKCAKAAALRGAFPDPLANVYIREELESNLTDSEMETEVMDPDEAKIEANQMREELAKEKMKKAGVTIIETTGKRPTPAEALAPAFEEDKLPQKPKKAPTAPPPAPAAPARVEEPDDLDMTPSPAQQAPVGASTPSAPAGVPPEPTPAVAEEPAWKDYIIKSFPKKVEQFHEKRMGDLSPQLLSAIEVQWLPAIKKDWEDTSEAQRQDSVMFEAAIAHYKVAKPW